MAAWWACSICAAIGGSATAHNVDTDFTGESVRSKPATVCGPGPGMLRDRPGHLPSIRGWSAMLGREQFPRQLGPDPCPFGR